MMFVDNNFFNSENAGRLVFGIAVAICFHLLALSWVSQSQSQKTISADLFSPPTNISIRFLTPAPAPIKEQAKIVEIVKKIQPTPVVKKAKAKPLNKPVKKKIVKKEIVKKKPVPEKVAKIVPQQPSPVILNEIEPAAAAQQVAQPIVKSSPPPAQTQPQVQVKATPKAIPVVNERNLTGRRVAPKYPARAEKMGQEGTVWLRVLISETGTREDIKIHKASKYASLNQAAVKAVKKWTFSPNLGNGQATKSWVEIPVEFKIQ